MVHYSFTSTETRRLELGRTAQDGHLDSHTAPELWPSAVSRYVSCWRQAAESRVGTAYGKGGNAVHAYIKGVYIYICTVQPIAWFTPSAQLVRKPSSVFAFDTHDINHRSVSVTAVLFGVSDTFPFCVSSNTVPFCVSDGCSFRCQW